MSKEYWLADIIAPNSKKALILAKSKLRNVCFVTKVRWNKKGILPIHINQKTKIYSVYGYKIYTRKKKR